MTEPFAELEPAQAEEIVARFVAGRPRALANLRDRLAASGQDDQAMLDGSVASLAPLRAWIKDELLPRNDDSWESEPDVFEGEHAPEWYRHDYREEPTLSLDSIHLSMGWWPTSVRWRWVRCRGLRGGVGITGSVRTFTEPAGVGARRP